MAAGSIIVDLLMRTGSFVTDTDRAAKRLQKFQQEVGAAAVNIGKSGLAIAGAMAASVAALDRIAGSIAQYQDLADKVGDTATNVSKLQLAADQSGMSLDSVASASVKLTASLATVRDAGDPVAAALAAINIPLDEFRKLGAVDQLNRVAQALASFEDGAGKTAIAVQLFGRSGAELMPFLNDLAEAQGRNTGLTEDQIEAADRFSKQLATLRSEVTQLGRALSSELFGPLNTFLQRSRNEGVLAALFTPNQVMKDIARANELANAIKVVGDAFKRADDLSKNMSLRPGLRAVYAAEAQNLRGRLETLQREAFAATEALKGASAEDAMRRMHDRGFRPQIQVPNGLGGASRPPPRAAASSPAQVMAESDAVRSAIRALEATDVSRLAALQATLSELLSMEAGGGTTPALAAAIADVSEQIDKLKAATYGSAILDPRDQMKVDFLRSEKGAYEETQQAIQKATVDMDEFAKNAAQSMQSYLGTALVDIFDGNFRDIGRSFADLMKRMAAEALAADLTRAMFGKSAGGTGDGVVIPFLKRMFSGSGERGVDTSPGRAYWVGEQGPEMFVPRTAGTVVPAGMGGNVNVYNYGAQVETRRESNGDLAVIVRAASEAAYGRVVDDLASGTGRASTALRGRGVNLDRALPRRT